MSIECCYRIPCPRPGVGLYRRARLIGVQHAPAGKHDPDVQRPARVSEHHHVAGAFFACRHREPSGALGRDRAQRQPRPERRAVHVGIGRKLDAPQALIDQPHKAPAIECGFIPAAMAEGNADEGEGERFEGRYLNSPGNPDGVKESRLNGSCDMS